ADAARDAIRQLASDIVAPGFELVLNRLIKLSKGFVCLAPTEAPPALLHLAASLAERLAALGLALDSRPYLPHMTLTRQAASMIQGSAASFSWEAERFVLYQSHDARDGVRDRAVGR